MYLASFMYGKRRIYASFVRGFLAIILIQIVYLYVMSCQVSVEALIRTPFVLDMEYLYMQIISCWELCKY
jgi:hypothetical protein